MPGLRTEAVTVAHELMAFEDHSSSADAERVTFRSMVRHTRNSRYGADER